MLRRTAEERFGNVVNFVGSTIVNWVNKERRKANIRLAVILGLVALCFYLVMVFLNPV